MRPDKIGWTVYEIDTGRPVSLGDLLLIELEHEDADALVDLLNRRVTAYESGREHRQTMRDAGSPDRAPG
jgi:hypothetical protein